MTLPLNGHHTKRSTLDEFFPVAVSNSSLTALPLSFNGSGDILAALYADGIGHHPADVDTIFPQTPVDVRLFKK
jgi:molybdopterin biosynthesis enzyme